MIHLRAKNLPEKGIVEKWLFENDTIQNGQDFALIRTDSNQEVIVKSHLDGVVVKLIKIGSPIKNGGILANLAVGEIEISKFRNRVFKEGHEEFSSETTGLEIVADGIENLTSAEDELDNFSGAVVYDRNLQATTPFSSGQEIMDSSEKYQKIVKRDEEKMSQQNSENNNQPKDRFAQMRANIAASIKNGPNASVSNLNDADRAKISKMSNDEALKEGNLFSTDNSAGVSKFRQLIQSRKEKLLKENDFQEVNNEDLQVNAMSKVDEKGRPLIMRNIIANRLEKYNNSGGDPASIKNEVLATKENAVKNMHVNVNEFPTHEALSDEDQLVLKNFTEAAPKRNEQLPLTTSVLLGRSEKQYINNGRSTSNMSLQDNQSYGSLETEVTTKSSQTNGTQSTNNNQNSSKTNSLLLQKDSKVIDTSVKESPFARQGASEDGEFAVSYGSYIDNEESQEIDMNDIANSGALVQPTKKRTEILSQLKNKTNKTYAESKLQTLYDTDRRWNIMKSRTDVSDINNRRAMIERGEPTNNNDIDEKVGSNFIGDIEIPDLFLKESIIQDESGKIEYVPYRETIAGKLEFENWLRSNNLYAKFIDAKEDSTMRVNTPSQKSLAEPSTVPNRPQQPQRVSRPQQVNYQNSAYKPPANAKMQRNNKTIDPNTGTFTYDLSVPKDSVLHPRNDTNDFSVNSLDMSDARQTVNEKIGDNGKTVKYLQEQVEDLRKLLEGQNQLKNAEKKLQQDNVAPNTDQTFSQMMQMMMMQNLMNMTNNSTSNNKNESDLSTRQIKKIIQEQLNEFKEDLSQGRHHSNQGDDEFRRVNTNNHSLENMVNSTRVAYDYEHEENKKDAQREAINQTSLPAVKSMILSQNYIPPLTISTDVDMTSILKLKHVLKKTDPGTQYPTILFIAKALSISLLEFPKMNSSYDPESNEVIIKSYHNIGLATETSEGLIIPVLKFVEKLSLKELAIDIQEMTTRLRRGELYNYETSGSTITLANYGNIGAIQATPTIFYPNSGVVGVGKIVKKPVVVENEKLAIKAIMNISLTVDQRIIDNAVAGGFLARMKDILEKPELITVS